MKPVNSNSRALHLHHLRDYREQYQDIRAFKQGLICCLRVNKTNKDNNDKRALSSAIKLQTP